MLKNAILFLLAVVFYSNLLAQGSMLDHAIAEDDHAHKHPLTNAIELHFAGVTASLNLKKDGSLSCGSKSLEEMYLIPLKAKASAGGGMIYPGYKDEFILVLEIRSDEELTLKALETLLGKYHEMLSEKSTGTVIKRAVRLIAATKNGKAFEYKHQSDFIFQEVPFNELPDVSMPEFSGLCGLNFRKIYDWSGLGAMPNMQYHSFNSGVKVAAKKGYLTRIYNFPEVPNSMDLFLGAGIAYLQIKDREAFVRYWKNRKP
ncbi:MAG: hypothetical protein KDC13_05355 [Bacteroidetes bacterium]|nr:hypothetical protein [Bacteroidota bacterium]